MITKRLLVGVLLFGCVLSAHAQRYKDTFDMEKIAQERRIEQLEDTVKKLQKKVEELERTERRESGEDARWVQIVWSLQQRIKQLELDQRDLLLQFLKDRDEWIKQREHTHTKRPS